MTTIVSKCGPAARFLQSLPANVRAAIAAQGVTVEGDAIQDASAPPQAPETKSNFGSARARKSTSAIFSTTPSTRRAHTQSPAERRANKRQRIAARRERQREREYAAEARILDRVSARIVQAGGTIDRPHAIPVSVWRAAWQVRGDASGAAARVHLRQMKNRAAAGAIITAALGGAAIEDPRSWAQPRVRAIAAFGIALVMLAAPTRRRGRWQGIVRGVPRGAFAAMLHDPHDDRPSDGTSYANGRARKRPGTPHVTTLFGTHSADRTDRGYFHELRDAGLVYRQQLPSYAVSPCEKNGPSGHANNRYWVVSGEPLRAVDERTIAELGALIAAADATCAQWLAALMQRSRSRPEPQAEPPS